MTFYCKDCEMIVREEDVVIEKQWSEAWGHPVYEEFQLCPNCGEQLREYFPWEHEDEDVEEFDNPFKEE